MSKQNGSNNTNRNNIKERQNSVFFAQQTHPALSPPTHNNNSDSSEGTMHYYPMNHTVPYAQE